MKKIAFTLIIALGLIHNMSYASYQYCDFDNTQHERVETQIQEEMILITNIELKYSNSDVFYNQTSIESISLSKSRIWKPPVN